MAYAEFYADFICWGPQKGILEIEIKNSWSDYQNDYKKGFCRLPTQVSLEQRRFWKYMEIHKRPFISKHNWLLGSYECQWRPEYFIYAAPRWLAERIANDPNLPKSFGVWPIIETKHGARVGYVLKKMRRLIRLKPEQHGKFRKAMFDRALHVIDRMYY
jgi:hypothetical protein